LGVVTALPRLEVLSFRNCDVEARGVYVFNSYLQAEDEWVWRGWKAAAAMLLGGRGRKEEEEEEEWEEAEVWEGIKSPRLKVVHLGQPLPYDINEGTKAQLKQLMKALEVRNSGVRAWKKVLRRQRMRRKQRRVKLGEEQGEGMSEEEFGNECLVELM